MKIRVKYEKFFEKTSVLFGTTIRVILSLLLIVIMAALLFGIYKTGNDLITLINEPVHKILQTLLLDTIFILALIEISITLLLYLKEGSVHVRYIIDTVLVVILNEVVMLWFSHPEITKVVGICLTIVTLGLLRYAAIKYSPSSVNKK